MNIVVDTDVIAAALLGEPRTAADASRVLARRWDLHAPAHWKAELANVLWKASRTGRLRLEDVTSVLSAAEALPIASVETAELWRGAVARAVAADHPAYDALFVELAARLGTRVVSFDRQMRAQFPGLVHSPSEALGREPR